MKETEIAGEHLKTFAEVEEFLNSSIPNSKKEKYKGAIGLNSVKRVLELLDNPQEKYKTIHVAGTSGKGSVSYLTAKLLASQGFKIGLTTSPHAWTVRERFHIFEKNEEQVLSVSKMKSYAKNFLSAKKFVQYFNEILPTLEQAKEEGCEELSYYEVLVVLYFYTFAQEKVDYAVVEVGLGGLLDASNVISREDKICVINKIGLDHTEILGDTLAKIAEQKAGIIQRGNNVFVANQENDIVKTIEKIGNKQEANLELVDFEKTLSGVKIVPDRGRGALTVFDFEYKDSSLEKLKLGLVGSYQAENCVMALTVSNHVLKKENTRFDIQKARKTLKNTYLPGRFEKIKKEGKTVILDLAHNPQKIESFVETLKDSYSGKKFTFVFGQKASKDAKESLKILKPLVKEFVFFKKENVFSKESMTENDFRFASPEELENLCLELEISDYKSLNSLNEAAEYALKESENIAFIGSTFSLEEVYNNLKFLKFRNDVI